MLSRISPNVDFSALEDAFDMKLTAKRSAGFYVKAAQKMFSDQMVEKIRFSATGSAISTLTTVVVTIEKKGIAKIEKVETSLIPLGPPGRTCPHMTAEAYVVSPAKKRWRKFGATFRAAAAFQQAVNGGHILPVSHDGPPVSPSHWRYLWDSRRRSDVPVSMQVPNPLPEDLELICAAECAMGPEAFIDDVCALLSEHYVEDEDGMFRFNLTADYLRWALLKPATDLRCLVAIRTRKNATLVAFFAAIPLTMRDGPGLKKSAMVDFMCVHRDWRGRRLCPFLYHEVQTRCYELLGIDNLICTSGDHLAYPVADTFYHHRNNPNSMLKLISCGFAGMIVQRGPDDYKIFSDLEDALKFNAIPESPIKLREMKEVDVPLMRTIFNRYVQDNFTIAHVFDTDEDFAHTFLPRKGIIATYIVESQDSDTEMVSFYFNDTTILSQDEHEEDQTLRAANVFYSVVTKTPRDEVLNAAMAPLFNEHKADTMNCLAGIMGFDAKVLRRCKFGKGCGNLKWYLYNAMLGRIDIEQIAWLTT